MDAPEQAAPPPTPEENASRDERGDSSRQEPPELRAAARAVEEAKARLHEAKACYAEVREEARARLEQVRETRLGDVIDGVLKLVRKHPGPSVIVALLAGLFLGRKFHR